MSKNQSSFKVLSDRDHILMRAGMYIGSISLETVTQLVDFKQKELKIVPGLLKIINEIIDNSIDEAIRTEFKFANKISVNIDTENNIVTVTDNGRGIPVVEHNGIYQAEASWTKAKAGTSFSDDRTTIGTNGVGSFATNCFSTSFIGQSCDGTYKITVDCQDNCNADLIRTTKTKSTKNGTSVSFRPDLKRFGIESITEDHLEVLKDRLFNIQICYPDIQFEFNGTKIKTGNTTQIASRIHQDALPLSANTDATKIILAPSGDDQEFRFTSYVNGLNLTNGGNHIDYIMNNICNELRPLIKRKWKIEVLPAQIKQHLFLGIWTSGFVNPKFDSQSKERLTNTQAEISQFFNSLDYAKIAKKIMVTENIIMPMIEAILYKKEQAEKKAAKAALKSSAKIKSDKLVAATNKDPEAMSIFLAEGLCFDENTVVWTSGGIRTGKALKIGDYVMTHNGNIKRIISKSRSLKKGIRVNGRIYSPEHRLYVYNKISDNFEFVAVKDLNKTDFKLLSMLPIEEGLQNHLYIVDKVEGTTNTISFLNGDLSPITFSDNHDIILFNENGFYVDRIRNVVPRMVMVL